MLAEQAEDIPLKVVFEDDTLLVIDKPVGLVVHPGSGNWSGTLLNALLHHDAGVRELPRAGIVHRLDKDTSGLLVVAGPSRPRPTSCASSRRAASSAITRARAWRARRRVGAVDAPIGRHPVQRTKMAVVPGGREA